MRARLLRVGLVAARWLAVALIAVTIGLGAWYGVHPVTVGPKQPIPFSHRVHAGDKQISCLFCHPGADRSSNAGIPEVGKCLLCHNVIIPDFQPIANLHQFYDTAKPIPWTRVYKVQDFAYFNHEPHLRQGVDCGVCHGDVKSMDRIQLNQTLTMGFCVDCHRKPEYKATVDCWACHR